MNKHSDFVKVMSQGREGSTTDNIVEDYGETIKMTPAPLLWSFSETPRVSWAWHEKGGHLPVWTQIQPTSVWKLCMICSSLWLRSYIMLKSTSGESLNLRSDAKPMTESNKRRQLHV